MTTELAHFDFGFKLLEQSATEVKKSTFWPCKTESCFIAAFFDPGLPIILLSNKATWSLPMTSAPGFFLAILFAFSLASLRLRARADSPNFGVSSMLGSLVVKAMPKVFSNEDLYLELDAKIRPENRFCISTFVKSCLDLLLKVYNLYLILSLPYRPMRL